MSSRCLWTTIIITVSSLLMIVPSACSDGNGSVDTEPHGDRSDQTDSPHEPDQTSVPSTTVPESTDRQPAAAADLDPESTDRQPAAAADLDQDRSGLYDASVSLPGATEGGFFARSERVPDDVRARMDGVSMRPGCPVGYDSLRYLTVTYRGFDGSTHRGELVVNAEVADDVVDIFRDLFTIGFPITSMRLVDDFGAGPTAMDGADDFASIEADNTSAFNCRARVGSANSYSEHSYGWAIDLNPLINPYVQGNGRTAHVGSRRYLDRDTKVPGLITDGDEVVRIFAQRGWGWGGTWSTVKDYQHFSKTGR